MGQKLYCHHRDQDRTTENRMPNLSTRLNLNRDWCFREVAAPKEGDEEHESGAKSAEEDRGGRRRKSTMPQAVAEANGRKKGRIKRPAIDMALTLNMLSSSDKAMYAPQARGGQDGVPSERRARWSARCE